MAANRHTMHLRQRADQEVGGGDDGDGDDDSDALSWVVRTVNERGLYGERDSREEEGRESAGGGGGGGTPERGQRGGGGGRRGERKGSRTVEQPESRSTLSVAVGELATAVWQPVQEARTAVSARRPRTATRTRGATLRPAEVDTSAPNAFVTGNHYAQSALDLRDAVWREETALTAAQREGARLRAELASLVGENDRMVQSLMADSVALELAGKRPAQIGPGVRALCGGRAAATPALSSAPLLPEGVVDVATGRVCWEAPEYARCRSVEELSIRVANLRSWTDTARAATPQLVRDARVLADLVQEEEQRVAHLSASVDAELALSLEDAHARCEASSAALERERDMLRDVREARASAVAAAQGELDRKRLHVAAANRTLQRLCAFRPPGALSDALEAVEREIRARLPS
jgi:hypothetical protein